MDISSFVSDEKARMILEVIQKEGPVEVQYLINYFENHQTCRMSKATFYRHLKELIKNGPVRVTKKNRKSYYSMKSKWRVDVLELEGLKPKKEDIQLPPSDYDYFVLDEMKKLVSDMIASGLDYETGKDEYDCETKVEARIQQRLKFGARAWTLLVAVTFLEENREYELPSPKPIDHEDWLHDRFNLAGNEMEYRYSDYGVIPFQFWLDYYISAIDALSRALSNSGANVPSRKRKDKSSKSPR